MKVKKINIDILLYLLSKNSLLLSILCVFIPFSISAQLYTSKDLIVYSSDDTKAEQYESVFIASGTTVVSINENQNIKIIYLQKDIKKQKNLFSKKADKKNERTKKTLIKETGKQSSTAFAKKQDTTSLEQTLQRLVVSIVLSSQNTKQIAIIPKIYRIKELEFISTKTATYFLNKKENWNTVLRHNIRPPPSYI